MSSFEGQWRARFERFGRTYTEEHAISGWSAEGLTRRTSRFKDLLGQLPLPKSAKVLELGCGTGTYVRYLAGLGHVITGVDYALPVLGRALEADAKGRYVAADGYELPFVPGSFDLVVCIGVLQAVSRPEQLLDEIIRVLRGRGIIVVEALNALEIPAAARRLREIINGRPARVRRNSPFQVRGWLEQRDIQILRRVGIYLPPRRFPGMGRIFDLPGVTWLLEETPGVSVVLAHAFWLVGRKWP